MENYNETKDIPQALINYMDCGRRYDVTSLDMDTTYGKVELGKVYYGNFGAKPDGGRITTIKIRKMCLVYEGCSYGSGMRLLLICDTPSVKNIHFKVSGRLGFYDSEEAFIQDMKEGKSKGNLERVTIDKLFPDLYREYVEKVEGGLSEDGRFRAFYWYGGKPESSPYSIAPHYIWKDEFGEHVIYKEPEERMRTHYRTSAECIADNLKIEHFPSETEEEPQEMEFTIPVRVTAHDLNEARKKLKKIKSISVL